MAASEPATLIYKDKYGMTPLAMAANGGHEAVLKLLKAAAVRDLKTSS
jgi:hypothetical protein